MVTLSLVEHKIYIFTNIRGEIINLYSSLTGTDNFVSQYYLAQIQPLRNSILQKLQSRSMAFSESEMNIHYRGFAQTAFAKSCFHGESRWMRCSAAVGVYVQLNMVAIRDSDSTSFGL